MSSHPSVSRPMLVTVLSCSVSPGTRPGGSASTSRERDHHAPSSVPARDRVVSGLSRTETGLADSRNRSGRNAGNDVSQSSAMARHPSARPGRAHSPGGRRRGHRASEPPRCPHRTPTGRRTLQPDRVGVASPAPAAIRAGPHRPDQQPRYFGPLLADSARASQNVAASSSGSPPWWASAAPRPGTGSAGRRSSTAPQATSTAAVRSPEQRRRVPRIDHPVLPRQVDAKVGAAGGHGGGQVGKEMVGAGEDRTGSQGRGRRRRRPAAG